MQVNAHVIKKRKSLTALPINFVALIKYVYI